MRPVRRRGSPQASDFADYTGAKKHLVSRLGSYCSYCERLVVTQLAVEHVQPKGLAQYEHLIGRWENFLLGCVNCNSTKLDQDVDPATVLLPDRDNTFVALRYEPDGTVRPSPDMAPAVRTMAASLLTLAGLDKPISEARDENGKLVAIDRVAQRMEAWATARDAKDDVDQSPGNAAVRRLVAVLSAKTGFFSIWMTVFQGDADMRNRLIDAFAGTRQSGCFDPVTTEPRSPAPNPDGLANGGKS